MKKILLIILGIILVAIVAILFFFRSDSSNPYDSIAWGKFSGTCETQEAPKDNFGKDFVGCDYSVPKEDIPSFKPIDFPFSNEFDNKRSLPVMAAAMIDIDNDGVDEVFVSGGVTQADALFKYSPSGFVDISSDVSLPAKPVGTTTFGASSFDLDGDGRNDLLLSGDYGLRWLRNVNGKFRNNNIQVPINDRSNALTTTIGDFNRDGHADIFLSNYIKIDKMEGQTIFKDFNYGASSLLLQNNGDQTFTDVSSQMELDYVHNTFQGVFVDINHDGWLDLVVAYDTGEVRTYKNIEGTKFEMVSNPMTGKYGYPMGIAVGDYNNDGRVDFFFSNTGTSVPEFLAKGDLAEGDVFNGKWILFRNDGNFKFTDVAKETKVADFEFSWGAIFEDFNLDGRQDLVVAENYVDFPPHKLFKLPGRFLLQRPDGTFAAVEDQANAVNKNYAISPVTSDWNQDGYPDLLFSNLDGQVKALINAGGDNNWIGVRLPETSKYAGSLVAITLTDETILSDNYVVGEGLGSDQTATLTFGLSGQDKVSSIDIRYGDGSQEQIPNPEINKVHFIQ